MSHRAVGTSGVGNGTWQCSGEVLTSVNEVERRSLRRVPSASATTTSSETCCPSGRSTWNTRYGCLSPTAGLEERDRGRSGWDPGRDLGGRHGRSGWSEKSRKAGKRWGKCWRALTSSSLVRGELHLQPGRSAYVMHVSLDALLVHALDAFTPQHLPSLRRVLPLLVKHHGAGEVGSAGGVLIAVEVEAWAGDVRCGREDTRVHLDGAGSRVVQASPATNRTGLEWTIQGARRFPPRARGPPISWIFLELYDIREFREMRVSVGARTYLRGEDLHEGSALKGGEHGARPSS